MNNMVIDCSKYIIRSIEEQDAEQVVNILRGNTIVKRMSRLEDSGEKLDSLIKKVYLESDTARCVVLKETGVVVAFIDISQEDDEEGEVSISLLNEVDISEFLCIIGEAFKASGRNMAKSMSMQYSFE